MKKIILLLLLIAGFSGISAQKAINYRKHAKSHRTPVIKYGTASFYAKKFDGRQTANGEIFSSKKYTAACNVLPLNTWVKVTNLKNHRIIIVRINDRMNPQNRRLIDLSRIAANNLGFLGRGLARVKVEVLTGYHPDVVSK
jgi:peptidoglycan lytic transglycosylase